MNKILLLPIALLALSSCQSSTDKSTLDLNSLMGGDAEQGYARAIEARQFSFPDDHASHPDFRNEWWYFTGNLETATGHEFGYQVTLFRIAITPKKTPRTSHWSARHVWMGHVALTDISNQKYYNEQRFARDATGLAGFQQQPFKVWLEDWQITAAKKGDSGDFPWNIKVKHTDFTLNLKVLPAKKIILQGDKGLSQKSAAKGSASYYYSISHMQTSGQITIAGKQHKVTGKSWLDREWSTSALGKDQAGWDWFSLQFNEGIELMYYQIRKKTGDIDAYSRGKLIMSDGSTTDIHPKGIQLTPLKTWTSPQGRKYPIAWQMRLQSSSKSWRIEARVDDQEMIGSIHYWEGAVQIVDESTHQIVGKGYLEMTGY